MINYDDEEEYEEDEEEQKIDLYPEINDPEIRGDIWAHWSSKDGKDSRPEIVRDTAEKANLKEGKDVNDHFGFRVAYMMFKYQQSYEEVRGTRELQLFLNTSGGAKRW